MTFESTPCWEFLLEPASDPMILILMVASCAAILVGLVHENWDPKGALEGCAILIAISLVVSVSAYNDWSKEQEFLKLQEVYASSQK